MAERIAGYTDFNRQTCKVQCIPAAFTVTFSMQEAVVRQDELLLTLGSYHSPMALCIDEFGLAYTGHAQLKSDPLPSAAGKYSPLLECR